MLGCASYPQEILKKVVMCGYTTFLPGRVEVNFTCGDKEWLKFTAGTSNVVLFHDVRVLCTLVGALPNQPALFQIAMMPVAGWNFKYTDLPVIFSDH